MTQPTTHAEIPRNARRGDWIIECRIGRTDHHRHPLTLMERMVRGFLLIVVLVAGAAQCGDLEDPGGPEPTDPRDFQDEEPEQGELQYPRGAVAQ